MKDFDRSQTTDDSIRQSETALRETVELQHRTIEVLQTALERYAAEVGDLITIRPRFRSQVQVCQIQPDVANANTKTWWPALSIPKIPMQASNTQTHLGLNEPKITVVAVSVLGIDGQRLDNAISIISERQRQSRDFIPVFLTDASDQALLRSHGYIFEYFPKASYQPERNVESFRQKLLLVWKKWNVISLIDLGAKGYLKSRFGDDWIDDLAAAAKRENMNSRFAGAAERVPDNKNGATTKASPGASKEVREQRRQLRHVRVLRACLRLGFEREALDELRHYRDGPTEPQARRRAAWVTALWLLDKDDFQSAVEAYGALSILKTLAGDKTYRKGFSVILIESLIRIGRIAEAKATCLSAWDQDQNRDFALAMSNVLAAEDKISPSFKSDELRLSWINRTFGNGSSFHIRKGDQQLSMTLDNIEVESVPLGGDLPLVSVIMPAFNAETYISTSMESVLSQTWRNIELIVVDDASTDRTLEIAGKAAQRDKRIKIVSCPENMGVGCARNVGLLRATGEFVTVQDADDWGHPKKIELQAIHLLSNSQCAANLSEHVRTTTDLVFSRWGKPGFYISQYYSSLMFRREETLRTLGFWDSVRGGVDSEYLQRFDHWYGKKAVVRIKTGPMLFARIHEQGLTSLPVIGRRGFNFGARLQYHEASKHWHQSAREMGESLRVDFPQVDRPFPAPLLMTSNAEEMPHRFDVVIATDFRVRGGTNYSSLEEIKAQIRAGLRTGLMHIPRYEYLPNRQMVNNYRELVDGKLVHVLTYGDEITADLVIFRWPPALANCPKFLPNVRANNVRIILNQAPQRRRTDEQVSYDIEEVDRRIEKLFGKKGVWAPIGPEGRAALEGYSDRFEISAEDWVNILDLSEWSLRSERPRNLKPVIGRHARDNADKWPETVEDLLRAYPDSSDCVVSILGGAEVPKAMLGTLPRNWIVRTFDAIRPYDYLCGLDLFVYFTHSKWIEAFGRVIFEAMAVGVPVLLAESFRANFGDAALYSPIADVKKAVQRVLEDENLYADQVRRGRVFVERNHVHDTHIRRISPLVKKLSGPD